MIVLGRAFANGANVNARNDSGTTPLHLAAYPGIVEILVAQGGDLESRYSSGNTALHAATEHPEHFDVMEKLLELGANVNSKNIAGRTALDIAVSRNEHDKIDLLRRYGARSGNAG